MRDASDPPTARQLFAKNLRLVRRLREISQEAMALDAGLSRSYVSQVERGERNVSIDNMGLLADSLGVPLYQLLHPDLLKILDDK